MEKNLGRLGKPRLNRGGWTLWQVFKRALQILAQMTNVCANSFFFKIDKRLKRIVEKK